MSLVQSASFTGLNTVILNCPNTDVYTIQGSLQLPNIVPSPLAGPGGGAGTGSGSGPQVNSQVVTVIKHNSTTVYTSNAGDRGFITGITATAGDTISVILSSSLAQDEQLNAAQVTIALYEGESI
jgi:hypothetical protein